MKDTAGNVIPPPPPRPETSGVVDWLRGKTDEEIADDLEAGDPAWSTPEAERYIQSLRGER